MIAICRRIAHSDFFHHFIISVIVLAGILVGLETDRSIVQQYGFLLHIMDQFVLWIFVAEAAVKILAEGKQPLRYFRDPWNVFDFTIVAVCFLPLHAEFVAVLRLARILRVFKLVTALPKLQLIVSALLKSIPSMIYVILLLNLLFYIYAVLGTFSFGVNDPFHFGTLTKSMLTLFQVVTLEGWVEVLQTNMYGCDQFGYDGMKELCTDPSSSPIGSVIYFVSFILFGTMIVLNLFIGVIMNAMEEVLGEEREKEHLRKAQGASVGERLHVVADKIGKLQTELRMLAAGVEDLNGQRVLSSTDSSGGFVRESSQDVSPSQQRT